MFFFEYFECKWAIDNDDRSTSLYSLSSKYLCLQYLVSEQALMDPRVCSFDRTTVCLHFWLRRYDCGLFVVWSGLICRDLVISVYSWVIFTIPTVEWDQVFQCCWCNGTNLFVFYNHETQVWILVSTQWFTHRCRRIGVSMSWSSHINCVVEYVLNYTTTLQGHNLTELSSVGLRSSPGSFESHSTL